MATDANGEKTRADRCYATVSRVQFFLRLAGEFAAASVRTRPRAGFVGTLYAMHPDKAYLRSEEFRLDDEPFSGGPGTPGTPIILFPGPG